MAEVNLFVVLAIFSGRPDPEWSVLSSHPKFTEIKQLLDDARTHGFTYGFERMPARLGYKGFLVKATRRGKPELIVGPETAKLQILLLETAPDDVVPQGNKEGVLQEITEGKVRAEQV